MDSRQELLDTIETLKNTLDYSYDFEFLSLEDGDPKSEKLSYKIDMIKEDTWYSVKIDF